MHPNTAAAQQAPLREVCVLQTILNSAFDLPLCGERTAVTWTNHRNSL